MHATYSCRIRLHNTYEAHARSTASYFDALMWLVGLCLQLPRPPCSSTLFPSLPRTQKGATQCTQCLSNGGVSGFLCIDTGRGRRSPLGYLHLSVQRPLLNTSDRDNNVPAFREPISLFPRDTLFYDALQSSCGSACCKIWCLDCKVGFDYHLCCFPIAD
jgi:hypothetical protein